MGDYLLRPLGLVRSCLREKSECPKQAEATLPPAEIRVKQEYRQALEGLYVGQQIQLITWMHLAERSVLKCHPRGDSSRPLRGVMATRSPDRPNPLGLHPCRILNIEDLCLTVHPLEVLDQTPVVDIKPLMEEEGQEQPWGKGIDPNTAQTLRQAGRDAWQRGLVSGRNGNLSLLAAKGEMVITCSGSAKGRLKPGDLVRVALDSLPGQCPESMSSEGHMHASIYSRQPMAGAVVHTHPPALLSLSLCLSGSLLDLPLYEADVFASRMATLEPKDPGSLELAEAVGQEAQRSRAIFLQGHGLVCWAASIDRALDLSEELEGLARIRLDALPARNGCR